MRLINRKLQTALDVLQVLHCEQAPGVKLSRHALAKRLKESPQWLGLVLTTLAKQGFVTGMRGWGYVLAEGARERTLRDLFNALEREYVTSIARPPETASEQVSLAIATLLERLTLEQALTVRGAPK